MTIGTLTDRSSYIVPSLNRLSFQSKMDFIVLQHDFWKKQCLLLLLGTDWDEPFTVEDITLVNTSYITIERGTEFGGRCGFPRRLFCSNYTRGVQRLRAECPLSIVTIVEPCNIWHEKTVLRQ